MFVPYIFLLTDCVAQQNPFPLPVLWLSPRFLLNEQTRKALPFGFTQKATQLLKVIAWRKKNSLEKSTPLRVLYNSYITYFSKGQLQITDPCCPELTHYFSHPRHRKAFSHVFACQTREQPARNRCFAVSVRSLPVTEGTVTLHSNMPDGDVCTKKQT